MNCHWNLPWRAVGCEAALRRANSGNGLSHCPQRTITWSARFLVVDAEVRVIREEIELVTEALDYGAGKVARIRQSSNSGKLRREGRTDRLAV